MRPSGTLRLGLLELDDYARFVEPSLEQQVHKWKVAWRRTEKAKWLLEKYPNLTFRVQTANDVSDYRFRVAILAENIDTADVTFYNLL